MLSRRGILSACTLVLMAAVASGAYGVAANAPGVSPLYIPMIAHDEPALSQIVGLGYSFLTPWDPPDLDAEIYTLRADGAGLTRLTDNDWQDSNPRWSPDGTLILWNQGDGKGTSSVYNDTWLMNSDGSNARDISNLPGSEGGQWSPSGNNILIWNYDRDAPAGLGNALYVTTPTASTLTPVIGDVNLTNDQWSPTGEYISFVRYSEDEDYVDDLYTAHADGSNVTLVASDINQFADWSPDGAWLAYEKKSAENLDVYISRPDGSETRPLATTPADERAAGWVEGGARLLVSRVADESNETSALDLVSVSGATTTFVTSVPGHSVAVHRISPDGTAVVYEDTSGSDHQLKLQTTDSLTPLTISPVHTWFLGSIGFGGWSHDGRQVAYTFVTSVTARLRYCDLYVANVDGINPVYQLVDPASCSPLWLPHSPWLRAYDPNGDTLQLLNPRTGARLTMPRSFEHTRLTVAEWRYVP